MMVRISLPVGVLKSKVSPFCDPVANPCSMAVPGTFSPSNLHETAEALRKRTKGQWRN